ncbi:MAG TPA: hypothetical protein VK508_18215 [Cyclobacteriaceae bacterium]|nr:hypothetical protein [Cyclobacteriaceae bacterium]
MVVAQCTFEKLCEILEQNGWKIASNEYWNDHNRIIFEKGNENFPLQYKKVYNFLFVVPFFKSLEITPPEDCLKNYEELSAYRQRKKEDKENGASGAAEAPLK